MRRTFERDLASLGYLIFEPQKTDKISSMTLALLNHSFLSVGFYMDFASNERLKKASMKEVKMFYFHAFCLLKKCNHEEAARIESYVDFPSLEHHSKKMSDLNHLRTLIDGTKEDYEEQILAFYKKFPNRNVPIKKLMKLHIIKEKEGISILGNFYTALFAKEEHISFVHQERIPLFMQAYKNKIQPQTFAWRSNLMFYAKALFENEKNYTILLQSFPIHIFKTVTDVLHFYAEYSRCRYLTKHSHFQSLNRRARKLLLAVLDHLVEQNENVMDEFNRYKAQWKKALRELHVGDYASLFPHVFKCAQDLRNDTYETTYKKIETAISLKDKVAFSILKKNPTIFRKKLDDLLRNSDFSYEEILEEFTKVIASFSSLELIRLLEYYQNRNLISSPERLVTYSMRGKYRSILQMETRKPYEYDVLSSILKVIEDGLKKHYAKRDVFKDVYVSEEMKNFTLPLYELDCPSKKIHPFFGTTFSFQVSAPILRLFFRTIDKKKAHIKLYIHLFDENFRSLSHITDDKRMKQKFHRFCSTNDQCVLCDRTSFIDVEFAWLKRMGRYAALRIHNSNYDYTLEAINECYAGLSFQNEVASADSIYVPDDASICYPVALKNLDTTVLIIDTKEQKIIYCDNAHGLPLFNDYHDENILLRLAKKRHLSLYDLMMLHQEHMSFVFHENEAQYVIDASHHSLLPTMDAISVMEWIY